MKKLIDTIKENTHISNSVFPVIKFLKGNSNHIIMLFLSKAHLALKAVKSLFN